jgi:hypothetical protein
MLGHGDERARIARLARGELPCVPGDLRGRMPQEVRVGQRLPDSQRRIRRDARGVEPLARERLGRPS